MNDRIKELRVRLNFNQSDFSSRIGIGQAGLSAIEKGIRNVTDRTIKDICREFNVNEEWLRTGNGEMYNQLPDEDELAKYIEDLLFGEDDTVKKLIKSVIRTYGRLDDKSREVIINSADVLLEELKKEG